MKKPNAPTPRDYMDIVNLFEAAQELVESIDYQSSPNPNCYVVSAKAFEALKAAIRKVDGE